MMSCIRTLVRALGVMTLVGMVSLTLPFPAQAGGVQVKAAELLGMSFRSFRYYVKKYNLR